MSSPFDLTGRVAIVTGAAGGLGRTVCTTLRSLGCEVVDVDLTGSDTTADVATEEGNAAMVGEAIERFGRLDILVLNAGMQRMAPIPDFDAEEFRRLLDVMVTGPFLAIKHGWRHLIESGHGRVVVTASTSSRFAEPFKVGYTAAKHGVVGVVRVAALEGAAHGITANAVAPGGMLTPLVERQMDDQRRLHGMERQEVLDNFIARHAVKRFVETDEVANTIAFLASDAGSGITGAVVDVDLGLGAW